MVVVMVLLAYGLQHEPRLTSDSTNFESNLTFVPYFFCFWRFFDFRRQRNRPAQVRLVPFLELLDPSLTVRAFSSTQSRNLGILIQHSPNRKASSCDLFQFWNIFGKDKVQSKSFKTAGYSKKNVCSSNTGSQQGKNSLIEKSCCKCDMAAASSRGIQMGSAWFQRKINLRPQHRGVHLVTEEILRQIPEINNFTVGLFHIQILHTSASLALNESWDPDVRDDMESMLNKLVPEGLPYKHSCEGPDDMPAHVKACLLGSSLSIPISDGKLNLGTWQGIWLAEHRNSAGSRKLVVTLNGVLAPGTPISTASSGQNPHSHHSHSHS